MTAASEALIENNDTGKYFSFRAIAPIKDKVSSPVIAIPLVNTSPDNTFLFRFIGKSEDLSFNFAIFNDGFDASNGSSATAVTSILDQIEWLRDTVYGEDFDVDFTFTHTRYASAGVNCVITNLEFDNQAGGVGIVTATITLKRGRIGTL